MSEIDYKRRYEDLVKIVQEQEDYIDGLKHRRGMTTYKIQMFLNADKCRNYRHSGQVSYYVYQTVNGPRVSETESPSVYADEKGLVSWINGLNMTEITYLKITEI